MPFRFPPPPPPVWLAKAAPTPAQLRALHTIANRLEPQVARNFEAAMQDLQDDLDLEAFITAVQNNNRAAAEAELNKLPIEGRLQPAIHTVTTAFEEGALLAQVQQRALLESVRFDLTNPEAIGWADQMGARLVTRVSDDTKTAIREVTARALRGDVNPQQAARQIRPLVGLTSRDARAVDNLRASLIERGTKPTRITEVTDRYAARLLRARGESIARTEIIDASSEGQQQIWQQAVDQGLLDKQTAGQKWICSAGACAAICAPMNGQVVGLGQMFTTGDGRQIPRPTAHPKCRCGIVLAVTTT